MPRPGSEANAIRKARREARQTLKIARLKLARCAYRIGRNTRRVQMRVALPPIHERYSNSNRTRNSSSKSNSKGRSAASSRTVSANSVHSNSGTKTKKKSSK